MAKQAKFDESLTIWREGRPLCIEANTKFDVALYLARDLRSYRGSKALAIIASEMRKAGVGMEKVEPIFDEAEKQISSSLESLGYCDDETYHIGLSEIRSSINQIAIEMAKVGLLDRALTMAKALPEPEHALEAIIHILAKQADGLLGKAKESEVI